MIPALAIGTAWVIVACAIAPKFGRAMKDADPGEDRYEPPTSVPQPNDSWMALVPADCLTDDDPELHGRFWGLVGAGWEI